MRDGIEPNVSGLDASTEWMFHNAVSGRISLENLKIKITVNNTSFRAQERERM